VALKGEAGWTGVTAGVAKVCITPPMGTWQGGFGARTRTCEGVHDDLFARAVVLGDPTPRVAIVSVDLVGLTQEVAAGARRVAEEATGIPAGNIALCASHTHGGPASYGILGYRPEPDPEYLRMLERYLGGVVAGAARDLSPVTIRLGRSQASFAVNRRRRNPDGSIEGYDPTGVADREVLVLRLDHVDPSGGGADGDAAHGAIVPGTRREPLAVLFRYACHATAMGSSNYLITADYPGAAAAFVEGAYDGQTLALFLQGCAGNIRPFVATRDGGRRGATWEEVKALGKELGAATIAAAEGALPARNRDDGAPALAAAGTAFALPFAAPPPAQELRRFIAEGTWSNGQPLRDLDRLWAAHTLKHMEEGTLPSASEAEVQVFRLGAVWLVALPGEVFVEIGWQVRDAVAVAAGVTPADIMVVAYANGGIGYVPTAEAIEEGGYEPNAYRHHGRPAGYVPDAGDRMARIAAEMAASIRPAS
jgi:neutral ceramidase